MKDLEPREGLRIFNVLNKEIIKVMKKQKYTKTQLKKDQIAMVLETLVDEFNAQIEDADGGRMDIIIDGFHGQFSRRDLDVVFNESIPLYRPELFEDEVVARHKKAVELEEKVNKELRLLMASELMFAHEEAFINYMNR
jgi:hypothetical protein